VKKLSAYQKRQKTFMGGACNVFKLVYTLSLLVLLLGKFL
jgi:hypothetical protein